MLNFKRIDLTDREWIEPLLAAGNFRGSEYAFSNNFIYRKIYRIDVAQMNHYYVVRSRYYEEKASYLYPAGSGDIVPTIEAMIDDANANGWLFQMHGVTNENVAMLESLFPGRFALEQTRDNFDYLYESEKLITLSGKKLHSKRNFINRFKQEHDGHWSYEAITPQNLDECWKMNEHWCELNGCDGSESLQEEACAVRNCFSNFTALGLIGGILRLNGEIIAYSMGRPLSSDTFIVHIEKAYSEIAGAYPMINQQFSEHNCTDFQYVNREDDVGDEGLRKAKLSYRPDILLEKTVVTLKA